MTKKSLPEPITLQSHEMEESAEFPGVTSEKKVYNFSHEDDSLPMQADGTDEYLERCIASAQADFTGKKLEPVRSSADAALIMYLSAYLRSHPAPQHFRRALKRSIFGQAKSFEKAEQTDA